MMAVPYTLTPQCILSTVVRPGNKEYKFWSPTLICLFLYEKIVISLKKKPWSKSFKMNEKIPESTILLISQTQATWEVWNTFLIQLTPNCVIMTQTNMCTCTICTWKYLCHDCEWVNDLFLHFSNDCNQ